MPSASGTGNFTIDWGTASGTVTTYKLYQATNPTFSGQDLVYNDDSTIKPLSGRGNGTYYYRVRACKASGCSAYRTGGNPVEVTLPPGRPSSISVPSSSATGNYTIDWGSASGTVTAYKLYQATNSSFSGQALVYSGDGIAKYLPGRGNGSYYYRVRACNGSGCSSYRTAGNHVTVSILEATVNKSVWSWLQLPGRPPRVPSDAVTTASGGFGSYSYSWQRVSGDTQTTVLDPTSRSTGWYRNVPPHYTYQSTWRCRVTDGSGNITYTPNVTVKFYKMNFD